MTYSRSKLWHILDSIAPERLAGSWDNVGILLDPPLYAKSESNEQIGSMSEERILLTIDLTEEVFEEALSGRFTCILTYHPIIFSGLKRLTLENSQSRTLLRAAQSGIGIYSPHTALDAVTGGVCDWLSSTLALPLDTVIDAEVTSRISAILGQSYCAIEPIDDIGLEGAGRRFEFPEPISLDLLCERLKMRLSHANPQGEQVYLRTVTPKGSPLSTCTIRTIALCPGAGGGLFNSVRDVDLLVTGEMSHHDLLARAQSGTSVILTEHSRCERGALTIYAEQIRTLTGAYVQCSQRDEDPLKLYQQ